MEKIINIEVLKNNIEKLSKTLPSLNIDSIYIEQNEEIEKIIYRDNKLHELRSCSKLLVSMAIGIAIDRKMKVSGKAISLDTEIYPVIEKIVDIRNEDNLLKIKKWTIRTLLTHTTGYESQMMSEKYIENIEENCKKMFRSVGIQNGMMFMQCKVEDDTCIVYDIGYRLTGSLEYKILKEVCDFDPLEMLIYFSVTGKMAPESIASRVDPFFGGYYAIYS